MLDKVISSLKRRKDLTGWSVTQISSHGAQIYAVGKETEARRSTQENKYKIEVFRQTTTPDGSAAMGNGEVTLLPGGDMSAALHQASLVAGLVANPVYELPEPHALPDVALTDEEIQNSSEGAVETILAEMQSAASKHAGVELTSAESFAEDVSLHFVSSRGIEAHQETTSVEIEYVLQARTDSKNSETLREMRGRRVADLSLAEEVALRAQFTQDLLSASPPAHWDGPVVIRRDALGIVLAGDFQSPTLFKTLGDASMKYAQISPWEIGKPIFRGKVSGDPFTAWANRRLPYGSESNRFDKEGLAAQRTVFIENNKLMNFVASKRYAEYLKIHPTGDFGVLELPPGRHSEDDLLSEPFVEVCLFSWFYPDPVSGDFSSEIRLGYLVENGTSKPFRGGQLVGNFLDALANVRWGKEMAFYGNYYGPRTARFNELRVVGGEM